MSKLNKASAAKKAQQAKQYRNGAVLDGEYKSLYQQGHALWQQGVKYSDAWHPHKKQGWKAGRDAEFLLMKQNEHKPAYQAKIWKRIEARMQLAA